MKIQWISRDENPLRVEIKRKAIVFTESSQKHVVFSDGSLIENGNAVVLIEGPMQEYEKVVIVSQEILGPYIASCGSKGAISLNINDNISAFVEIKSVLENDEFSLEDIRNRLESLWGEIERRYENAKNRKREKGFRKLFLEEDGFADLDADKLTHYVSAIKAEGRHKNTESHYLLALTIIALIRARQFSEMSGLNDDSVYPIMADAGWIGGLIKKIKEKKAQQKS